MPGKPKCSVCGGESFTELHGLRVCDICGRQEEHYIELQSQETIAEVDRSRLVTTRFQEQEGEEGVTPGAQEAKLDNWTSYEAYNLILYEWTKALLKLGASPKVETIAFKLWVAYLQRIGIAFVQESRPPSRTSLRNRRDRKLIHEKAESVSGCSLHSYRSRGRKKKKAATTTLDKIKDKIERRKLKNALSKRNDSSFMNTTLASELSKSLNEFDVSALSDSCSSHGGDSRMNTSLKSDKISMDGSSHCGPLESETEVESVDTPIAPRTEIPRDDVVMNWIQRVSHIYGPDSEHSQDTGEEQEEEEEKIEDPDQEEDSGSNESINLHENSSNPSKQNTPKKAKRRRKSKTPESSKSYRKAEISANAVYNYRRSKLPFFLCFSKLLGILYLAVLLAEDDILLSDILRWCREGHIPYFSAPYLLRPDMELSYYDLFMLRNSKKLPDAQEVQAITGRLATFLSIQYVPLPPMEGVIRKFVKLMNLPEQVVSVAESLVALVHDMKKELNLPPVESMAMASIILTLKVYCGLDNHTEVMLSQGAATVRSEMPQHSSLIPFSWMDWQRHIARRVWVCCQVDPPSALHWQQLQDVCHFSPSIFSKFFWREGMWRVPRTSLKKKAELQILTEELLRSQGQSLEEVMMQPPLLKGSSHPLQNIIEQFSNTDNTTRTKDMHSFIKVAEELKDECYTNHSLNWFCEMCSLDAELWKPDSNIHMLHAKRGKPGLRLLYRVNDDAERTGGRPRSKELFIPNPLSNYWRIKDTHHATWEKLSASFPASFKWLVNVGSKICEAPNMQLITLICLLQVKMLTK